jgi:hypothetical protein
MSRIPNYKDSFETRLKEQVEDFGMTPGADSWNAIQQSIHLRNPRFGWLTVLLLFVFLVPLTIRIAVSSHSAFLDSFQSRITIPTNKTSQSNKALHFVKEQKRLSTSLNSEFNKNQWYKNIVSIEKKAVGSIQTGSNPLLSSITAKTGSAPKSYSEPNFFKPPLLPIHDQSNTDLTERNLKNNSNTPFRLQAKTKQNKQLQFFIVPSISHRASYRMLKARSTEDLSHHIEQEPSAGFEAGAAILIPVSNRLAFRTGLQFNFTHYKTKNITVFATASGSSIINNYAAGTLNPYADKIHNQSYQLSVPVGMEYKIEQRSGLSWYVAAHIQATYMMKTTGHLYVRSVQKPAIARDMLSRMNSHVAVETFMRWDHKKTTLQIGPQIRCQLRSNTHPKISSKEYLIDYGIKVGIVQTLY